MGMSNRQRRSICPRVADRERKLLADSGIWEEAGGDLMKTFLGPAGPFAFKSLLILVDVSIADADEMDIQQQITQAAENLNTMRFQYDDIQVKIDDLKKYCLAAHSASN